jgi:hypothetical protein
MEDGEKLACPGEVKVEAGETDHHDPVLHEREKLTADGRGKKGEIERSEYQENVERGDRLFDE